MAAPHLKAYTFASGDSAVGFCIGCHFPGRPDLDVAEKLDDDVTTKNRATHVAVKRALEKASAAGILHLIVHTDSKYITQSYTELVHKWEQNGFVSCKQQLVCDHDVIKGVQGIRQHFESVDFKLVPYDSDTKRMNKAEQIASFAAFTGAMESDEDLLDESDSDSSSDFAWPPPKFDLAHMLAMMRAHGLGLLDDDSGDDDHESEQGGADIEGVIEQFMHACTVKN